MGGVTEKNCTHKKMCSHLQLHLSGVSSSLNILLVLFGRVSQAQLNALITHGLLWIPCLTPLIAFTHHTSNLIAIVNLKVALINKIDNPSALINLGNGMDCVISFVPYSPSTLPGAATAYRQSI